MIVSVKYSLRSVADQCHTSIGRASAVDELSSSASRAIDALDSVPLRVESAEVDLEDAFKIFAEARSLAQTQILALDGCDERHAELGRVLVKRHETAIVPDLDQPLVFGWQIRAKFL